MSVAAPAVEGARVRMLHAALSIIGDGGVASLTNRAVAREAGVSLGSLTYHFESQTELLRESLLLFVAEEAERLKAFQRRLETDDLTFEEAGDGIAEIVGSAARREHVAQLELYLHAGRDPELRRAAERCFAAYDDMALAMLQALGVRDPEGLVSALVALVDGYELRRLALGAVPQPGLGAAIAALLRGHEAG